MDEEEEEEDSAGAVHSAAPAPLSHPTRSAFERHDQGRGGQKLEALAHTSTDRPSRVIRPRPRVLRPRDECDGDVVSSQCGLFPEENLRVSTPDEVARWPSGYCGVNIRSDNKTGSPRFYGMKKTPFPAGSFAPALPVIAWHACDHTFARDTCSLTR